MPPSSWSRDVSEQHTRDSTCSRLATHQCLIPYSFKQREIFRPGGIHWPVCGLWRELRALPGHEDSSALLFLECTESPLPPQAQLCTQLPMPSSFLAMKKGEAWVYPNLGLFVALLLQIGSLSCQELSKPLARSKARSAMSNAVHHSLSVICSQHSKSSCNFEAHCIPRSQLIFA